MTTKTAKRLLESVTNRMLRIVETSRLLDLLSSYDVCANDLQDEYERHLRMLEAAHAELDYARDMLTEAIKEQKRQIEDIKAMLV